MHSPSLDRISRKAVWGTAGLDADNIVWGTSADADVTWGSAGDDAVVYPDDADLEPLPSIDLEFGDLVPLTGLTGTPATDSTGGF